MNRDHKNDAKIFKALCDQKRLAILELLRDGEKCACDLVDAMNIGQSSLSYHMKILCESGIVDCRQEGKWTHYYISDTGSSNAGEVLKILTTPNAVQNNSRC